MSCRQAMRESSGSSEHHCPYCLGPLELIGEAGGLEHFSCYRCSLLYYLRPPETADARPTIERCCYPQRHLLDAMGPRSEQIERSTQ